MLSIAKFGDYTAQTPKKSAPIRLIQPENNGPSTNLIERDKVFKHNNSSVSGKPLVHVSFISINQSDRIETETVKVSDEWEICR